MSDSVKYGPHNPHPLSLMRTELVWEGKYDEFGQRREVDVAGLAMPLQKIETIDEPRSRAEAQGSLFDEKKAHRDDFRNRLIWGDNKAVLSSLVAELKGTVDLIYIDPPFDIGADFSITVPIGEGKEITTKDQSIIEVVAYRDTWGRGTASYLHMLYERITLMRELLSSDGSLYVHVGPNISHYVKCLLDEVMGAQNYRSEIVWRRSNSHNKTTDQYGPIHDVIFFYTKSDSFKFHPGTRPFTKNYIESRFKYKDHRGVYQPNYLTGPGVRKGDSGKPWRGYDPTKSGRHWAMPSRLVALLEQDVTGKSPQEILDLCEQADLLVIPKKEVGQPMYRQYLTEGVPYQDIWAYQANSQGVLYGTDECIDQDVKWLEQESEMTGFATQKPEGLIKRIIETSTDEGDTVADFFCGSGTTLAVAEKMGRKWIGSDLGRFAIHTARKRLIGVQRDLHEANEPYRSFDVYNLGRYERQWWQQESLKGAEEEHRSVVLNFFRAEILGSAPSPLLHGRKGTALVHVDGIDSIFTREELSEVAKAVKAAGGKQVHCLAWDFEMDIRQSVAAVESELGLSIKLHRIPREIMEKNRTEVPPFFEVALLEAEPVVKKAESGKGKTVDVKLVNFLPSLTEVPGKELEALQERAMESGFDFIDFWAVDFDWHPNKPFNHHWQDYRTRKDRTLKTVSDAAFVYERAGKHTICVKVVDVFGCDTSITVEVDV